MNEITPTAAVRAALASGIPPGKRELEHALRDALGFSARQARRLIAAGYAGLGAEAASDDAELLGAIERARDRLLEVLRPDEPNG